MIDPFVLLAPVLLLAVVALLHFVGCDWVFGLHSTTVAVPIAFEQIAQNQSPPNSTGVTTLSAMFNKSTNNGDLIIVALKWGGTATPTVKDGNDNVYTPLGTPVSWSAGNAKRAQLFYSVADGTKTTLTATLSQASTAQIRLCMCEYSEVYTASPIEGSPMSNTGSGPNLSCGSLDVTAQNMVWAVAFADDGQLALSQGSSFALRAPASVNDNPYTLVEDILEAPNTGNYFADGANTDTSPTINWVMLMVSVVSNINA